MKKIMAIALAVCMVFAFTAVTAGAAGADVAAIGSATYETLAAALNASSEGDTITLLDDVTENVTISKNITIDGAEHQFIGQITIGGKYKVAIENVNFVNSQIYKNKSTGASGADITVENCSFEGQIADSQYAINIGGGTKLTVKGCDAKNVGFGFVYVPSAVGTVIIEDVNIDGASYGVHLAYNSVASFKNVTIKNAYAGIMNQTYGAKTFTFENCVVKADYPVKIWERNATTQTLIFKGENNDFGTDDLTFGSSYVNSVVDVAKLGETYYTSLQAAIDACTAGDNTITLVKDCAEAVTVKQQAGINIVIDGNGKTYSGTINVDGNNRPNGAEALTIKNVKFVNTAATTYAYFINAEKNGKGGNSEAHNVTIEDCYFKSTNWHYAIATRHPYNLTVKNCTAENVYYFIYNPQGGEKITVEDCTVTAATYGIGSQKCKEVYIKNYKYTGKAAGVYGRANPNSSVVTLENVDITTTLAGQPAITLWANNDKTTSANFKFIFKGENNITAPEGTVWFARQSEENSPYEFAPKCYDNVVSNTVEFLHTPGVPATCQAAQFCTECGEELEAVKEHEFLIYVSNDDATCQADGTKTAECIYGCGLKDTIVDEGTMKDHVDANGNGTCDYCAGEFCELCGKLHTDFLSRVICLLAEFIRLTVSFFKAVA